MSIVLQSSGGGQITLQEPATASNFTQTLPAADGTILTSGSPQSGGVIQVVSATLAPSNVTTLSTSFVTSGFSASITPKFSSSRIFVSLAGGGGYAGSARGLYVTFYRNGTTNLGDATYGLLRCYAGTSDATMPYSAQFLDSPATISSTSYVVYFRSSTSSGVNFHATDNGTITLTLMEIAA